VLAKAHAVHAIERQNRAPSRTASALCCKEGASVNFFCGELCELFAEHTLLVLATIVASKGSAPRTSGARMLVLPDGSIRGTVGGGAYEAESIQASVELLAREKEGTGTANASTSGKAENATHGLLLDFSLKGVSDMDMVCGGSLTLLLEPLNALRLGGLFTRAQEAWERGEAFAFITRLRNVEHVSAAPAGHTPIFVDRFLFLPGYGLFREKLHGPPDREMGKTPPLPEAALSAVRNFAGGIPELLHLESGHYLLEYFPRPHRLYVFGAGHVGRALADLAHRLDFWTTILDDRPEFASRERFPLCRAEVLASLGREHTAAFLAGCAVGAKDGIVIITRGHAHDRDVLAAALDTGAGYIGMIGSKSKRMNVYASLRKFGFSHEAFIRVHSPIGVNIGAETPEEIAVSIAAELIQWRRGKLD